MTEGRGYGEEAESGEREADGQRLAEFGGQQTQESSAGHEAAGPGSDVQRGLSDRGTWGDRCVADPPENCQLDVKKLPKS